MQTRFPMFDRPVAPNGYCWWYIDAESSDQQHQLTVIAFIGSVFSPYYKHARKKTNVDPLHHCSLNVVLYGKKNYWCMTERHRDDVIVQSNSFVIGPSSLRYETTGDDTGRLTIDVNEMTVPVPRRVKGQIVVDVSLQGETHFSLDSDGHQRWWPAGPNSSISVQLDQPSHQWQGCAYVDMNQGSRPIENDLRYWCWSRFRTPSGTHIQYDVFNKNNKHAYDNPDTAIAIHIANDGTLRQLTPSTLYALGRSGWRMRRHARSDNTAPLLISALEDTPFYTRSAIRACVDSNWVTGMNESVSLTRFKKPIVQAMLRFRMPRLAWRKRRWPRSIR